MATCRRRRTVAVTSQPSFAHHCKRAQNSTFGANKPWGGAQVQSLTPTPLKHFGPLKGGGGGARG